jgi:hypothetical protein
MKSKKIKLIFGAFLWVGLVALLGMGTFQIVRLIDEWLNAITWAF